MGELINGGEKVGKRADEVEGRVLGISVDSSGESEQECGFEGLPGDVLIEELCGELSVGGRGMAGCRVGQPEVKGEEPLYVEVSVHQSRWRRAAASASLS